MAREDSTILVIGVGNEYRGDDAAGLHAVRRLEALGLDGAVFREESGEGMALIESWGGADRVLVIDAAEGSGENGESVLRFDAAAGPIPSRFLRCSSHEFGVAEAVELARALGRLPARLDVVGIAGGSFGLGRGLSPGVERALSGLVQSIAGEIRAFRDER